VSTWNAGPGAPFPPGSGPMGSGPRFPPSTEHVRNIALDIVLTILTLGLFNLWVQHRQMVAVNAMLGQQKYSFWLWLLLSLITCGIYHIYHEYRKSDDLSRLLGRQGSNDGLVSLLLTIIGLGIISDAIQQARINEFHGSTSL